MAAYVPIDLHRRRPVVTGMDADGEVLGWERLGNDPEALVAEVLGYGEAPEVAIEATYGWYWAVGALEAAGARVHLAAPSRLRAFEGRRVKTDTADCRVLGDLLRAGMLPEAWVAPPAVRELRELVRYRAKLVGLRSGLKAQVHSVLAKVGVQVGVTDLFGVGGGELLDRLLGADPRFASVYGLRVESLRVLVAAVDHEVDELTDSVAHLLGAHQGWQAIQVIPGVGPVLGAVFVAEDDDVVADPLEEQPPLRARPAETVRDHREHGVFERPVEIQRAADVAEPAVEAETVPVGAGERDRADRRSVERFDVADFDPDVVEKALQTRDEALQPARLTQRRHLTEAQQRLMPCAAAVTDRFHHRQVRVGSFAPAHVVVLMNITHSMSRTTRSASLSVATTDFDREGFPPRIGITRRSQHRAPTRIQTS